MSRKSYEVAAITEDDGFDHGEEEGWKMTNDFGI